MMKKVTNFLNLLNPRFWVGAVIIRALLFPYLPKWMQYSIKANGLIKEEISKTEKKIGKEKTQELIIQFKNEAYAQTGVNSDYIINKLRAARHGL
jgi:hypothetical protein